MSIHAISGKPGGGKSLYSLRLIVDELVNGSRTIVTNVPLLVGQLSEYLQKNFPSRNIDVLERVRVLTDDQAAEFWTYRPGPLGSWVRIKRLNKEEWGRGERPDYSHVTDSGVFYAIDEVHNFFGARQWQDTGRDVLFYLSQHRKLSDTVVWITQAVANVDKQFRSVTQDYTYLRNLNKERMGLFKLPAIFVRKTFGSPATDTASPMETGTFKLDVSGLAACYDTSAGVGIHGRAAADVKERRKGLHWSVFVIAVPLIIFSIYRFAPGAIAGYFSPDRFIQKKAAAVSVPVAASVIPVVSETRLKQRVVLSEKLASGKEEKPDVYIIGRKSESGEWSFLLSDGKWVHSSQLQAMSEDCIAFGGKVYVWKPRNLIVEQGALEKPHRAIIGAEYPSF